MESALGVAVRQAFMVQFGSDVEQSSAPEFYSLDVGKKNECACAERPGKQKFPGRL